MSKDKFDRRQCQNCFGRSEYGSCKVLTEPIEKKKCPFYKTNDEYNESIKNLRWFK